MQAGISTRLNQWWGSIPFITSGVILICGAIYLVCLLTGYDSFAEICFLPSVVASRFQGLSHAYLSVSFAEHKSGLLLWHWISILFWEMNIYFMSIHILLVLIWFNCTVASLKSVKVKITPMDLIWENNLLHDMNSFSIYMLFRKYYLIKCSGALKRTKEDYNRIAPLKKIWILKNLQIVHFSIQNVWCACSISLASFFPPVNTISYFCFSLGYLELI